MFNTGLLHPFKLIHSVLFLSSKSLCLQYFPFCMEVNFRINLEVESICYLLPWNVTRHLSALFPYGLSWVLHYVQTIKTPELFIVYLFDLKNLLSYKTQCIHMLMLERVFEMGRQLNKVDYLLLFLFSKFSLVFGCLKVIRLRASYLF